MIRRSLLLVPALALCALAATQLFAATPHIAEADRALTYIRSIQHSDGGFPSFTDSSAGSTIDASFAFAAAGIDPKTVTTNGKSPADYLAAQTTAYSATDGGAAKLVLGIETLRLDPQDFAGVDVLGAMDTHYDTGTGAYGDDVFAHALFILADVSAGRPVPANAITWLQGAQLTSGGWEDCCAFDADSNTTAMAILALVAAGVPPSDSDIIDALGYLHTAQTIDGGFAFNATSESDPNSAALVIQALVAAGQSIDAGGPWDKASGATPLAALVAFQNATTGALQYAGVDSAFATYQGVPALLLVAFPQQQPFVTSTVTAGALTATPSPAPTASLISRSPVATSTAAVPRAVQLPNTGAGHRAAGDITIPLLMALSGLSGVAATIEGRRRNRRR